MALSDWFSEKWDQAGRWLRRTQRKRRRQADLSMRRARVQQRARQRAGLPPEEQPEPQQAPQPEPTGDHHFAPAPEEVPAPPPEAPPEAPPAPQEIREPAFEEPQPPEDRRPSVEGPEPLPPHERPRQAADWIQEPQGPQRVPSETSVAEPEQDRESVRLLMQIHEALEEMREGQRSTIETLQEIKEKIPEAGVYGR